VVVGVISILAAPVVVNLRGARERAMDSRVASALGQVRVMAEMIHARTGNYLTLCRTGNLLNTTPAELVTLATEIATNDSVATAETCLVTIADYCVSAQLREAGQHWCVSSAGRAGRTTSACLFATSTC